MKMHCGVLLLLATSLLSTGALATGPDEKWEVSTQMQMDGMSMPGSKDVFCQPKSEAYDPQRGNTDKNCTTSDVRVVGNTSYWSMRCTGEQEMQGDGEMMRTADALNGEIRMRVDGMEMTMVMTGRRVGTCSAAAEKKAVDTMVADMQAQGDAQIREVCDSLIESNAKDGGAQSDLAGEFSGDGMCAAAKPRLCEQARSRAAGFEGYSAYAQGKGWVAAVCGLQLDRNRQQLCPKAFAAKQYRFLNQHCPIEAKAAKAQHCQGFGRGYTADSMNPYAALCRP